MPFLIVLLAVGAAAAVIVLCVLFGTKAGDPRFLPLASSMGTVTRKYHDVSGAAHNAYPSIDITDTDGTSRSFRLRNWTLYDDIWCGDRVQVDHRDWWAEAITAIERGESYWRAQERHTETAVFRRAFTDNVSWTRHIHYAEFATTEEKSIVLRTPNGWTAPPKESRGTLTWHGEFLESWSKDNESD